MPRLKRQLIPSRPATPLKILAIKLRSLGDTVLMTAPLLELTRAYPQAQLDVLVHENWAPLVTHLPGIHRVWTLPQFQSKIDRLKSILRLGLSFRREGYDCVINFHASPTSARIAWATGAPQRAIHFHGHRVQNRYSTVKIPGKGTLKPIIERDMDTLRSLGIHIPAGRSPQLFLQQAELGHGRELIQNLGIPQPILGLSLGASRPTKSWPIERFAALALAWVKEKKGGVLAIAGPGESQLIHTFLKDLDDLIFTTYPDAPSVRAQVRKNIASTHQLSLRLMASILSQISVLAGNDSGPKHVAVAVGTPTVTLFGPEHPMEWHPYPQDRHPYLFIENLDCRQSAEPGMPPWCGIPVCIQKEHQCMKLIGVDSVLEHCKTVAKHR